MPLPIAQRLLEATPALDSTRDLAEVNTESEESAPVQTLLKEDSKSLLIYCQHVQFATISSLPELDMLKD